MSLTPSALTKSPSPASHHPSNQTLTSTPQHSHINFEDGPPQPPPSRSGSASATSSYAASATPSTPGGATIVTNTVSLPGMPYHASSGPQSEDPFQELSRKVLPLFNQNNLDGTIEELKTLVSICLSRRISALFTEEVKQLLKTGMKVLHAKLYATNDSRFLTRVVDTWTFFFGTIVPYLQGVLLPLQMEIKASPWVTTVRTMILMSFRDWTIAPLGERLESAMSDMFRQLDEGLLTPTSSEDYRKKQTLPTSRLLQMFLILNDLPLSETAGGRSIGVVPQVAPLPHSSNETLPHPRPPPPLPGSMVPVPEEERLKKTEELILRLIAQLKERRKKDGWEFGARFGSFSGFTPLGR